MQKKCMKLEVLVREKSFKRDAFYTFMTSMGIVGLNFLFSVLVARMLGPTGKGAISLIVLVAALLAMFGNMGISMANIYHIGKSKYPLSSVVGNSFFFSLSMGGVLALVYLALFFIFRATLVKDLEFSFMVFASLLVPFMLFNVLMEGVFVGKNLIVEMNKISVIAPLLALIGAFVFLEFVMPLRIIGAVIAILFGNAATSFAYLNKALKLTSRKLTASLELFKESILYGIKGQAGNIVQFFNYRLDFFLVYYFVNISQLGIYAISVGLAELIWRVPNSAATVLFPRIASSNSFETAHFTMAVSRRIFLIMLGFVILLVITGKLAIFILFGGRFSGAYVPLLLLTPGVMVLGISNVLAIDLAGRGRPEVRTYGAAIAAIATLVLDLLLIPKIGINGAALASSISYTIAAAVIVYFFRKLTRSPLRNIAVPSRADFQYFFSLLGDATRKFINV